jgi:hypothetical protein
MNRARSCLTLFCFSVLSLTALSAARAEFRCDQPKLTRVDATACAKAAESATALRQYISRTQQIYGLKMSDYARFVGDEPAVAPRRSAAAAPAQAVAAQSRTQP